MGKRQEQMNSDGTLSLYELNSLVADVVSSQLNHEYWVVAELSDVHERGGHCYMDLIEKDEQSNTPEGLFREVNGTAFFSGHQGDAQGKSTVSRKLWICMDCV